MFLTIALEGRSACCTAAFAFGVLLLPGDFAIAGLSQAPHAGKGHSAVDDHYVQQPSATWCCRRHSLSEMSRGGIFLV
jgi:hypothetical protein